MADGGSIVGAAAGWGISAVGSIVSPIITDLLYKGFSYLGIDRSEKLKELETKVLQLKLVLESLEKSPDKGLERLLQRLKSALYDAEDIFDDVEYYRLERQILPQRGDKSESDVMPPREENSLMKKLKSAMASKRPRLEKETSVTMSGDVPPDMSKSKLKKIVDEIENIIDEAHKVVKLSKLLSNSKVDEGLVVSTNSRSAVTTMKPPNVVIGRDKDRDKILALLHDRENDGQQGPNSSFPHSIIGIHGIPGSGKSTLAQLVCAHEKKDKQVNKEGHFDLIMWVHVSQNFSPNSIFSQMLEEATEKSCHQFKSLNSLEKKLEKALSGKKVLLVLDDVWYNKGSQQELQKILSPMEVGAKRSKILVTSRTDDALSALGAGRRIPISEMDDNVFLELFMHYALEGAKIDEQNRRTFEVIGADIAKKLRRSPLAATTVGRRLRIRPNVDFWRNTRDRDLLNETMGALWWSYQNFAVEVRRCFAYCSIFPRRYVLKRDELVNLWVAEGFIRTDTGEDQEAVAGEYCDELVSSAFLKEKTGWEDCFTVHDLLHDLAEKVAGSECFRIQKCCTEVVPQDVRRLFIEIDDEENISNNVSNWTNLFKNLPMLRVLIITHTGRKWENLSNKIFESVFKNLPMLRVLIVKVEWFRSETEIFDVPQSINLLRHLRYFGFRVSVIPSLYRLSLNFPNTFVQLYHLEVLDATGFMKLSFSSSKDMINIPKLRHVIIDGDDPHFPHIGRHELLQTFNHFTVKNEEGYELYQLKRLNKLRGELNIYGLNNVSSNEDALQAELHKKKNLTRVKLSWDSSGGVISAQEQDLQSKVLEDFRPPVWLQTFQIVRYKGSAYPDWMITDGPEVPECLKYLKLEECRELGGEIPERNKFFKHLCTLHVDDCNWTYFPDNMERLESLQELLINDCSNLQSLPTVLPQSLLLLRIARCNRWNHWPDNMEDHQSLLELRIEDCGNIESLPAQLPSTLQKLKVTARCYKIRSLPEMPRSLLELILGSCNRKFIRSCKTRGHQYYKNISHVPKKTIRYDSDEY